MSKPKLGYQLLSVFKDATQDLRGVLERISGMGYAGVEFIGLFGHEASEVRGMLDELGLIGMSNMMPIDSVLADPYKIVSDCKIIGCKYVSLLVMDPDRVPGGKRFSETLRDIRFLAGLMREAGIQLLYHHHGVEFNQFSGQLGLDFIIDTLPEGRLWPEIDCYWVQHSGLDPVEFIKKYSGRCDIIHLKDNVGYQDGAVIPEGANNDTPFDFAPVGHGWQDTKGQVKAALESGCKWLIVEQEKPSPKRTQYEAAKMSINFLKGLDL